MAVSSSAVAFEKVRRLAGKAIADYRMIDSGDHLMVGVSGGLDSLTLLEVLHDLRHRAPVHFEIEAVTFDPGFEGFNAAAIGEYCRKRGYSHRVISLDIPPLLASKKDRRRPCVLCSRLRRGNLYSLSLQLGCNKLALGHHLDDIAVSFLMSMFRGQGLSTMGPHVAAENPRIRVIRPMAYASEELVKIAAKAFDFPHAGECLYRKELEQNGDREYFKNELKRLAERIPDVREAMLRSLSDVRLNHLLDRRYLKFGEKE